MLKGVLCLIGLSVMSIGAFAQSNMKKLSKEYVLLALDLDQYDKGYVDAYIGPEAWKREVPKKQKDLPYVKLKDTCKKLIESLDRLKKNQVQKMDIDRMSYLRRMLLALEARLDFIHGKKWSFDTQSELLYDAVAPSYTQISHSEIRQKIEQLLPGSQPLSIRFEAFRNQFLVPQEKLDLVFKAAIEESKRRSHAFIKLPLKENFEVEYVKTEAGWSAYNWYKGNYKSVIQVNTSVPIYIDQIILYASHEGYPGHHVQNVLREKKLMKEKSWMEYALYPLFAPTALFFEGSADFGASLAFSESDRVDFEKKVLFPLAGLDSSKVELYRTLVSLRQKLSNEVTIETGRAYLDQKINREQAIKQLMDDGLESQKRAENRVRFFDNYGAYVINYHVGEGLVRDYVLREVTQSKKPYKTQAWAVLEDLYSTPKIPSDLRKD